MKISAVNQLEILLSRGTVQIERTGLPCEYEVTVFTTRQTHSHHGGATLAEAFNRAVKATDTKGQESK